ncbi:hypothetical protein [Yoonia maricola]|nr:hypothetical protein [Yoonia maricola]
MMSSDGDDRNFDFTLTEPPLNKPRGRTAMSSIPAKQHFVDGSILVALKDKPDDFRSESASALHATDRRPKTLDTAMPPLHCRLTKKK